MRDPLKNERQKAILKEAEAYRITHQKKKQSRVQNGLLRRMGTRLGGLLHCSVEQLEDQGSRLMDEKFVDGYS